MVRILSLDDEPEMVDLFRLMLERQGYELTGTSDSYEAWAMLHAEPFDLFMQDIARPDVDGWEFYKALKADEHLRDLPVAIITARARDEDKALGAKLQVDAYVTKPFGPQELLTAIENVLRKYDKHPPVVGEQGTLADMPKQPIRTSLATLQDPDSRVQQAAARGLGLIGERQAVEPLIQALRDDVWTVRCPAAMALARIKDTRAVESLIQALQDEVSHVRMMAALALGEIEDARAVEPLLPVLTDRDSWVRQTATRALGQIADPRAVEALARTLRDKVQSVCQKAAYALTQIGEPASEVLIKSMSEDSAQVREAVAGVLWLVKDKRERVVDALIIALQDEDVGVRRVAVWSLHNTGDKRAVEPLIAVLQDEDMDVVQNAIFALRWIGDARTIPHLQRVAREDTRRTRYGEAIADVARRALGQIGAAQKWGNEQNECE
jgi:HEAT repeat protein/CheY-like chemotaxis protein